MEEVWRLVTIDDYGDKYSVSSLGRIRNNDTWEILKPHEIKGGYLRVNLYPRGNARHGGRRRLVHRIVAFAFLSDDYIDGVTIDVNHIDGNKHNNSVENLEWCTREHNMRHAQEHGFYDEYRKRTSKRYSGESNIKAEHTNSQIEQLFYEYWILGESIDTLQVRYGYANRSIVLRIVKGKRWKSVILPLIEKYNIDVTKTHK